MKLGLRLQNQLFLEAMGARQKQWVALLSVEIGTL